MGTAIDFLYLSETDMIKAGVMDMQGCIDAMEEMLKTMGSGDYVMGGANRNSHGVMVTFPESSSFPNMPVNGPDRRFMAMPAYLGGNFDMAGVKWYGSNAANRAKGLPRSILMLILNDKDTGAPIAFMSANILSAYRTGAIPGVGIRHLARKDARVVAIDGPGVMNRTLLKACMCERPQVDTLKIHGHGQTSIDKFIAYAKENFQQIKTIEVCDTLEAAVRDADIISTATSGTVGSASYPYIKEAWLKPGAMVCLPANGRFDDEFVLNRAKNVVDNIQLYKAWQEEIPYPAYEEIGIMGVRYMDMLHEGKMKDGQIDDLGDILMGKKPGRRDDEEIILYSVGGMPTEDVAWGTIIYRNALKKGIGVKLNLWDKPAMA
ncbi:ornithine cyclodeaminase [Sporomusaceae bacterium BoRhaA]|uniref:tyramine oxidase subunit B n=1 Tax=Pelorhabdus rhamnosifermentans TaxID=2772457 RepID=UPI001C061C3B|nr:tyramine oxidase subunit B [Pelorhabdus rhamnosifermentans]MBU2700761.1 ornithine cyclodeaminase [Pelorhabdus rhamnosifermentans]